MQADACLSTSVLQRDLRRRYAVTVGVGACLFRTPARGKNVQLAFRRAEHGQVGLAVAVVVTRHGYVGGEAKFLCPLGIAAGWADIPVPLTGAEDRQVCLAVSVVVP